MSEPVSYRFGPVERRGLLGPLRAGQALWVGAAATLAVAVLDRFPSAAGACGAIALVAVAAVVTTVPVAGRSTEQWAPLGTLFALRLVGGRLRHRSPLPSSGASWRAGSVLDPEPRLPPALRGVELVALGRPGSQVGAIRELRGRRLTAVLACRARAFALLDASAQEQRLGLWGSVLSGAADTPVRRLQWLERTAPAQAEELARWLRDARDPELPPRGTPIVESYLELISAGVEVAHTHELLLAIQVEAPHGRLRDAARLELTLLEQLQRLTRGLEIAEVMVLGALGAGPLARAIRTAFDPFAGAELAALAAARPDRAGIAPHEAGPLGAREAWDSYQSDGAVHATYWIAGWPRIEVSPMFLDPLLGSSQIVRTVAVTFEPVPPERSTREVEAAITRDRADSELRRRFGQSETARQRQAQEAARRRESELAAGHGEVRFTGFVTVSGRDQAELRRACEELHQQAARARLQLHRMYGQQAQAFTFTLPLARGLR